MLRRYTVTHSEATGDLFLTIGAEYDWDALTTWEVRVMADEVVAEWVVADDAAEEAGAPTLVVHCRAQGGWLIASTERRIETLRGYMPMVLEAIHIGDTAYLEAHPELDAALVELKFHFRRRRHDEAESWGTFGRHR